MKKGTLDLLKWLIVALIVIFVIFFWVDELSDSTRREVEIEACKDSILMMEIADEKTARLVDVNYACEVELETVKEDSPREYYTTIADDYLRTCWYKTLGRNSPIGIYDWFTRDRQTCFVCWHFTVSDDVSTAGISQFLENRMRNSDTTYVKYLNSDWKAPGGMQFFTDIESEHGERYIIPLTTLKKDQNYLTVYTFYNKDLTKFYKLPDGWEYFSSGEGNEIKYRHLFIIPEEDFSELSCEDMVWQRK